MKVCHNHVFLVRLSMGIFCGNWWGCIVPSWRHFVCSCEKWDKSYFKKLAWVRERVSLAAREGVRREWYICANFDLIVFWPKTNLQFVLSYIGIGLIIFFSAFIFGVMVIFFAILQLHSSFDAQTSTPIFHKNWRIWVGQSQKTFLYREMKKWV